MRCDSGQPSENLPASASAPGNETPCNQTRVAQASICENHSCAAVPSSSPAKEQGFSSSLKEGAKDALEALSLANLLFTVSWFEILFDVDHGYFNKAPIGPATLGALAVNIIGLAVLFWIGRQWQRRTRSRYVKWLAYGCFWGVILLLLNILRGPILDLSVWKILDWIKPPLAIAAAGLAGGLLLWQHRRVTRLAVGALLLLSPLALFNLAKVALLLMGVIHLRQHEGWPDFIPRIAKTAAPCRVIWILFDGLDQTIAFEQRPAAIRLPAFERLRRRALWAANAYPPGGATLEALPALIAGRTVTAAKPIGPSELLLTLADPPEQAKWSQLPSVFSHARAMNYATALVGWYHPYDRILGRHLDECHWFPLPAFCLARATNFSQSFERQVRTILIGQHMRRLHQTICQQSSAAALALATNAAIGLALLHLPPPHPPGVYLASQKDWTTAAMPDREGYLNNLVLADEVLNQIQAGLETAGLARRTWLIISADHGAPASVGIATDGRVPFIIQPPDSSQGQIFSGIINTVITRDLILAILRRELNDLPSVAGSLQQHLLASPPKIKDASNRKDSRRH